MVFFPRSASSSSIESKPSAAEKQLRTGVAKGFADALKARLEKAVGEAAESGEGEGAKGGQSGDKDLKAVHDNPAKVEKIGEAIEEALYRVNGKEAGQKYKWVRST